MRFFDARYFHRDMFEIFSDRCSDRILFPAVSEFLLVSLFVSPQLEILTNLNHNSIYEYHEVIYLLVGSLYFIPHHCNSTLSFGIPIDVYLSNVIVKISCFLSFFDVLVCLLVKKHTRLLSLSSCGAFIKFIFHSYII